MSGAYEGAGIRKEMIGIRKLRLGKSRVVYKPGEVAGEECLKGLPYMIFNGSCFSDVVRFGGGIGSWVRWTMWDSNRALLWCKDELYAVA